MLVFCRGSLLGCVFDLVGFLMVRFGCFWVGVWIFLFLDIGDCYLLVSCFGFGFF